MAKTHITVKTFTYVVYTDTGCTVTDTETGRELTTAEPGVPNYFTAMGGAVTLSDDAATLLKPVFKCAPDAIGLLVGGPTLPAGYTPLSFLQAVQGGKNNPLSYINVPTNVNSFEDDFEFATCHELPTTALLNGAQYQEGVNVSHWSIQWIWANSNWRMFTTVEAFDTGLTNLGPVVLRCKRKRETNTMVDTVGHMMRELPMSSECLNYAFAVNPMGVFWSANTPNPNNGFVNNSYVALGKKWWWKFYINGKLQNDLRPALDASGTPCMYDLVNSTPFYNVGRVPFVAGVETIQQLRRVLDNLPTTGGKLSLSLPAKANTPEIADMLTAASAAKGWTLTVHEYRPAAATTYTLRRVREVVWCRKVSAEYGGYVDATGTRWQVERCAAVFGEHGNDPAAYGYAPFDSVEQAAEEWGLQTYVYPEDTEQTID